MLVITVLMTCEPPPVVEDSLVRVSSAAEKRSQDAAEELQRQRSNQTNPDAETAAGWSISRDGSEFPVETNVELTPAWCDFNRIFRNLRWDR